MLHAWVPLAQLDSQVFTEAMVEHFPIRFPKQMMHTHTHTNTHTQLSKITNHKAERLHDGVFSESFRGDTC